MSDTDARERLVPETFEKYEDCPDCEVTLHGPQRANSAGGCHVELCELHTDGQSKQNRTEDVTEYGDRLAGAAAVMEGEADELAAHRPHADPHVYDIEDGLRGHADDLNVFLEEAYYR